MSDFLRDELDKDYFKVHAKLEKDKATDWFAGLTTEQQQTLWELIGQKICSGDMDQKILGQLAQITVIDMILNSKCVHENN